MFENDNSFELIKPCQTIMQHPGQIRQPGDAARRKARIAAALAAVEAAKSAENDKEGA